MRQCRPPVIAGRSRPNLALSASEAWPDVAGAGLVAAGVLPAGGSDCSDGPLGAGGVGVAAGPEGGARFWAGPGVAPGTSLGGRGTGVILKNCALLSAGNAESQNPTA